MIPKEMFGRSGDGMSQIIDIKAVFQSGLQDMRTSARLSPCSRSFMLEALCSRPGVAACVISPDPGHSRLPSHTGSSSAGRSTQACSVTSVYRFQSKTAAVSQLQCMLNCRYIRVDFTASMLEDKALAARVECFRSCNAVVNWQ